jgi:cytochrome c biogenesis protein CcmG/thiol:disulfide interchange protein DsbE
LLSTARRPYFKKRWFWITLGIIFVFAIGTGSYFLFEALQTPSSSTELVSGNRVGQLAPEFILPDLNGQNVSLSQFRGQLIILDFWASWCIPCRASMSKLHNLYAQYRDRGAIFIGVSLDRSEEDAKAYLAANGYKSLVALWGSLRQAQNVAVRYGVIGIPHTYLIDRDGIIRYSGHPNGLDTAIIETWL